jgi:hypothetical protein
MSSIDEMDKNLHNILIMGKDYLPKMKKYERTLKNALALKTGHNHKNKNDNGCQKKHSVWSLKVKNFSKFEMEDWMKNPTEFVQSVKNKQYFKDIDDYKYDYLKTEDQNDKNFLPNEEEPKNVIDQNEKNSVKFIKGNSGK